MFAFITLDYYSFLSGKFHHRVEVHDGIVCIANLLAQLGLINLQVIDNTNDTTTFHSQLNTGRLQIVAYIYCVIKL